MKRLWIATAVIGLCAAPAAAQQSPSKGQSTPPAAQSSAAQSQLSPERVRQNLEKSGFQDVSVVDAAYLVHARTSEGNNAVIIVDPPGAPATTGTAARSQTGPQRMLKEDLQKAGFNNVLVVDAAYLVTAKTSDGSTMRMMITPAPPKGAGAGARSPASQK